MNETQKMTLPKPQLCQTCPYLNWQPRVYYLNLWGSIVECALTGKKFWRVRLAGEGCEPHKILNFKKKRIQWFLKKHLEKVFPFRNPENAWQKTLGIRPNYVPFDLSTETVYCDYHCGRNLLLFSEIKRDRGILT